jgi:hypothetical protein
MRVDRLNRITLVTTPRLPPLKRAARLRATIEGLPADQAALFFFLAAQGAPRFTATLASLVTRTNCSEKRFGRLVEELVSKNLVTMHALGNELIVWGVPAYPQDWTPPVLDGRKFKIPGPPNGGGRPKRKAAP